MPGPGSCEVDDDISPLVLFLPLLNANTWTPPPHCGWSSTHGVVSAPVVVVEGGWVGCNEPTMCCWASVCWSTSPLCVCVCVCVYACSSVCFSMPPKDAAPSPCFPCWWISKGRYSVTPPVCSRLLLVSVSVRSI